MEGLNEDATVEQKPTLPKKRKCPKPKQLELTNDKGETVSTSGKTFKGKQYPEPEFKGRDFIVDRGRLLFKSEKVFACPDCNAYFAKKSSLKAHAIKHRDRDMKCDFCGLLFRSDEERTEHLQEFHPDLEENPFADPLRCKKCRKTLKDKRAIYIHIVTSHRKETFECEICEFSFNRPEHLQYHMKMKHTAQRETFSCEVCFKKYRTKTTLRAHIIDKHRRSKSYKCCICNTIYFQRMTYQVHMQRTHLTVAPYTCKLCNFSAYLRTSWVKHYTTKKHTEALANAPKSEGDLDAGMGAKIESKSIIPDLDDQDNIDKQTPEEQTPITFQELKRMTQAVLFKFCWKRVPKIILHRVDNIKVKNSLALSELRDQSDNRDPPKDELYLKCLYCDEEFDELDQVEDHERLCLEKRKTASEISCEVCGKKFINYFLLKNHIRTHTKEKPFKCSFCPSMFSATTSRLKHEKRMHFGAAITPRSKPKVPRVFQCSYENCGRKLSSRSSLKYHYNSIHLTAPKIRPKPTCTRCGIVFPLKIKLLRHNKKVHKEISGPIRKCEPCKRTYSSKQAFEVHLRRGRHSEKVKEFIAKAERTSGNKKNWKIELVKDEEKDDQSLRDSEIPVVKVENSE